MEASENCKMALAQFLGCDLEEINNERGSNKDFGSYFSYEGDEYVVFSDSEDAWNAAVNKAEEYLEYGGLNENFLQDMINEGNLDVEWFKDVLQESSEFYANDIKNMPSDTYNNRLIEEAIDAGVITEADLDEDGEYHNYDDLVYYFAEYLTEREDDPIEWYKMTMGEDDLTTIAIKNNLLDTRKVAEAMVNYDGVANYLSYDNSEETEDVDGLTYFIYKVD